MCCNNSALPKDEEMFYHGLSRNKQADILLMSVQLNQ
jgi:hypothetical protein